MEVEMMTEDETELNTIFGGGKRRTTATERYEIVHKGMAASERTLRTGRCNDEDIAAIQTARIALRDTSQRDLKMEFEKSLLAALKKCEQSGQCKSCIKR